MIWRLTANTLNDDLRSRESSPRYLMILQPFNGQQDIVPLWTAQKIKNTIPNAQMYILKECGHFPYIEKPNQLFDQIYPFLYKN
jgi:hypothetical protein